MTTLGRLEVEPAPPTPHSPYIMALLSSCHESRLASFTRIRDFVEDIRGLSTATISILKLFAGALLVVNLFAGAW